MVPSSTFASLNSVISMSQFLTISGVLEVSFSVDIMSILLSHWINPLAVIMPKEMVCLPCDKPLTLTLFCLLSPLIKA